MITGFISMLQELAHDTGGVLEDLETSELEAIIRYTSQLYTAAQNELRTREAADAADAD